LIGLVHGTEANTTNYGRDEKSYNFQLHPTGTPSGTADIINIYYTGYTQKNGAKNWLLPQLNTNYDDYILQMDGAPHIFTGMYECFSTVFNSAGSDVMQKETTTFSLGHAVRRI
jgi:hypothetical protein